MNTQEIKKFIAEKVPEGLSLSRIQDLLKEQGVNITFMELRLIAAEIESDIWKAEDAKKDAERAKAEKVNAMTAAAPRATPEESMSGPMENEEMPEDGMSPGMGRGMGRPEEFPEDLPGEEEIPGAEPAGMPGEEPAGMPGEEPAGMPGEEPAGDTVSGETKVELNRIARPGAVASGSVKFGSGVTAEWILDQTGRLGLDKVSGQPTRKDIMEFQTELQKLFR